METGSKILFFLRNWHFIIAPFILLTACSEQYDESSKSMMHHAVVNWKISKVDSTVLVQFRGEPLAELVVGESDSLVYLIDTTENQALIYLRSEIYLIDSGLRERRLLLESPFINSQNRSILRVGNRYILSSSNEFMIFDSNLELSYSSWEFLRDLPLEALLGVEGIEISWILENGHCSIQYDLYTDIQPFLKASMLDTIQMGFEGWQW